MNQTNLDELNEKEKNFLLSLARQTIKYYLENKVKLTPKKEELFSPRFLEKRGVFVTLHKNSDLRGCIGNIYPEKELYQGVIDNALSAAFSDPRFPPLSSLEELEEINIEISVLTPPQKLTFFSYQDLLNQLIPQKHGVILKSGPNLATFLPQVWQELPQKEEFLSHLCLKAGLSPDAWQKSHIEVYTYQAQVFSEKK